MVFLSDSPPLGSLRSPISPMNGGEKKRAGFFPHSWGKCLSVSEDEGGVRGDTVRSRKFARTLRKSMTDAELILWSRLRRRQLLRARFRRQHAIGPFIADFACVALKLVIEVDGETHGPEAAAYDARRTRFLEAQGWRVLRVFNRDVYENLEGVIELIGTTLAELERALTFQCGPSETAKNP